MNHLKQLMETIQPRAEALLSAADPLCGRQAILSELAAIGREAAVSLGWTHMCGHVWAPDSHPNDCSVVTAGWYGNHRWEVQLNGCRYQSEGDLQATWAARNAYDAEYPDANMNRFPSYPESLTVYSHGLVLHAGGRDDMPVACPAAVLHALIGDHPDVELGGEDEDYPQGPQVNLVETYEMGPVLDAIEIGILELLQSADAGAWNDGMAEVITLREAGILTGDEENRAWRDRLREITGSQTVGTADGDAWRRDLNRLLNQVGAAHGWGPGTGLRLSAYAHYWGGGDQQSGITTLNIWVESNHDQLHVSWKSAEGRGSGYSRYIPIPPGVAAALRD